ncbi:YafY family transcriptional regulator [Paenibacillus alvei]|uniref:YafY family transcriptional regulator n=1 Tax=Paenibacillus alvei TaxID=44250 RepID=A0ABT4H4J9_PAEAL|nr:YafY family protein [Paenibacillus alvei]MCY9763912.1 YafY family transcriptional regulator [Paenibacillus alvei]MCY9765394.1 YafY family transcriptional regulator [Paenibacillus alvei]
MKIDRLLSIVILLMNHKLVQAKELADRFEVSVRTIYRDIDAINQAGIPIVTYQGAGGGIGLAEGYRLDRNLLTNDELAAIVTALQSISSSHPSSDNELLVEKLSSIVPPADSAQFQLKTQQFLVDFSPWGSNGVQEQKLLRLKNAIEQQHAVTFTYCNAGGKVSVRTVEPYTLVLKQQRWYLYAYCRLRDQFRLFKLLRMKDLHVEAQIFERQEVAVHDLPWDQEWHAPERTERVVLRFDAEVRHMAEEWFGVEELQEDVEGTVVASVPFPVDNWLYGFILSFGNHVEVLEPQFIRQHINQIATRIVEKYETQNGT